MLNSVIGQLTIRLACYGGKNFHPSRCALLLSGSNNKTTSMSDIGMFDVLLRAQALPTHLTADMPEVVIR